MAEGEVLFDHRHEGGQDHPGEEVDEEDAGQKSEQEELGFSRDQRRRHPPASSGAGRRFIASVFRPSRKMTSMLSAVIASTNPRPNCAWADHVAFFVALGQFVIPDNDVRCGGGVALFPEPRIRRPDRPWRPYRLPCAAAFRRDIPLPPRLRPAVAVLRPAGLALHPLDGPSHLVQDDVGEGEPALGGFGRAVERPEEIRPALEAAFASGKTACINVMVDPAVISPGSVALANLGGYCAGK